ncbi:MAG: hypothetical protein IJQ12_10085 [Lachnospiraceae bacterium]|nr:hypothetical protein [Lachnospiraceae bacterium]
MAVSGVGSVTTGYGVNSYAWSTMQTLSLQRAQIKNGSYGKLLKAYVKKVGNKAALEAYRKTGSTTVTASSITGTDTENDTAQQTQLPAKKVIPRSTFLDDHLKSIGKPSVSRATASGKSFLDRHLNSIEGEKTTGLARAIAYAEQKTGRAINAEGMFVDLADKYKVIYNNQATAQNTAPSAVAVDVAV